MLGPVVLLLLVVLLALVALHPSLGVWELATACLALVAIGVSAALPGARLVALFAPISFSFSRPRPPTAPRSFAFAELTTPRRL